MRNIWAVAAKEIRDAARNRWIVMVTLVMAGLALALALLGGAPGGVLTSIDPLMVLIVSLSTLSVYLVPLIALLLGYDAVVGEAERGTLLLLLAYPVSRWQVIAGKFCGHLILVAISIVLGYGLAGLIVSLTSETITTFAAWYSFGYLLGSSILLGAVFLAIGYLISVTVGERGTAGAVAIGVWFFFVVLYDMGMLALLTTVEGQTINQELIKWLLLINPTDAYRLLNLTGDLQIAVLSGMSGLGARLQVASSVLVAVIIGWIVCPLLVSWLIFQRREL